MSIVEGEPYMAETIRDGLRLGAIASEKATGFELGADDRGAERG